MKHTKFSIIIPVKEINQHIRESVPIILNLDYTSYEILILPDSNPITIPKYLKDRRVRIISSGCVSPAIKRDIGAKHSKGEYLAFIDDDAYPSSEWLKLAESLFKKKKTAAIAGPAITPKDDTLSQKVSGLVFETWFGGGGLGYRYKPAKKSFYVEDYPTVNLIVSKKAFLEVGGFDNNFWPGEDTKFCLDLIKKGYRIWYSNKLIVRHHRRKLFMPHLKQVANYGKHRGYFAKKFPDTSFKLTYFIPSLFLIGNIIFLILSLFNPILLRLGLLLFGIYFIILLIDVFIRTVNPVVGILTILTIFLTHLTYGVMFMKGLFSRKFRSKLR